MKKETGFNIKNFIESPDVIILNEDSNDLKAIKNSYFKIKNRLINSLNSSKAEAVKNRLYNAGSVAIENGLMPHTEEYCLKMTAILLSQEEVIKNLNGISKNDAAKNSYKLLLDSGAFYTNEQLSYITNHIEGALQSTHEKSQLVRKL